MRRLIDLTGQVFERLVVKERTKFLNSEGAPRYGWLCECSCGQQIVVSGADLRKAHTRSCGCLQRELVSQRATKHGETRGGLPLRTKEYRTWKSIKHRCYNPRDKAYRHYGGRGISMSEAWRKDFSLFLADMGRCPEGMSIDRIDSNGNYEKSNCRWVDWKTQCRNKRNTRRITINGTTLSIYDWADRVGLKGQALAQRISEGWSPERAISEKFRRS